MIFIGMGTNLPLSDQRVGREVLQDALSSLEDKGIRILGVSQFYKSEPVPVSDQDWYVNAVAHLASTLGPERLLEVLHEVEAEFDRVRSIRNAARTLDLDLLVYGDVQRLETEGAPHLPHPRMTDRAFVLLPLFDLYPEWCHPVTGASLSELIEKLPKGQRIEPLEE